MSDQSLNPITQQQDSEKVTALKLLRDKIYRPGRSYEDNALIRLIDILIKGEK